MREFGNDTRVRAEESGARGQARKLAGNTNSRTAYALGSIIKILPRAAPPLYPPQPRKQQQREKNRRTRVAPLHTTVSARRHYFPRPKIKQRSAGTGSKRERHASSSKGRRASRFSIVFQQLEAVFTGNLILNLKAVTSIRPQWPPHSALEFSRGADFGPTQCAAFCVSIAPADNVVLCAHRDHPAVTAIVGLLRRVFGVCGLTRPRDGVFHALLQFHLAGHRF